MWVYSSSQRKRALKVFIADEDIFETKIVLLTNAKNCYLNPGLAIVYNGENGFAIRPKYPIIHLKVRTLELQ